MRICWIIRQLSCSILRNIPWFSQLGLRPRRLSIRWYSAQFRRIIVNYLTSAVWPRKHCLVRPWWQKIIPPFSSASIVQHRRIKDKVWPAFAHHSTNRVRANLPTGQGSIFWGRIHRKTFFCKENNGSEIIIQNNMCLYFYYSSYF